MSTQRDRRKNIVIALVGLLFATACVGWIVFYAYGSERTQTCTITGTDWATKVDVTGGEGTSSSEYRVQAEECGVMRVEDALLRLRFNSADLIASLDEGKTYELTTIGWRNGLLSWFPTIIDAKEVR